MRTTIEKTLAKSAALSRLPDVLRLLVPGFNEGRAFCCLNPGHADRNPSMRYWARGNRVHCFSCGWTGDVFDVVGAAYGLEGREAFWKTLELLGIRTERRPGDRRRVVDEVGDRFVRPRARAAALPADTIEVLRGVIFARDWRDAGEDEEWWWPEELRRAARMERGVLGALVENWEWVSDVCLQAGLLGMHFENEEYGEWYRLLMCDEPLPEGVSVTFPGCGWDAAWKYAAKIRQDWVERRELAASFAEFGQEVLDD